MLSLDLVVTIKPKSGEYQQLDTVALASQPFEKNERRTQGGYTVVQKGPHVLLLRDFSGKVNFNFQHAPPDASIAMDVSRETTNAKTSATISQRNIAM